MKCLTTRHQHYRRFRPQLSLCLLCLVSALNLVAQTNKWTVKTADTKIVLGINTEGQLSLFELSNMVDLFNWIKEQSVVPFVERIDMEGNSFTTNWKYKSAKINNEKVCLIGGVIIFCIRLAGQTAQIAGSQLHLCQPHCLHLQPPFLFQGRNDSRKL